MKTLKFISVGLLSLLGACATTSTRTVETVVVKEEPAKIYVVQKDAEPTYTDSGFTYDAVIRYAKELNNDSNLREYNAYNLDVIYSFYNKDHGNKSEMVLGTDINNGNSTLRYTMTMIDNKSDDSIDWISINGGNIGIDSTGAYVLPKGRNEKWGKEQLDRATKRFMQIKKVLGVNKFTDKEKAKTDNIDPLLDQFLL